MTNAQLYQKFVDDIVWNKTYKVPLSALVVFKDLQESLTTSEIESVCYAVKKVSEYREKESIINK